MRILTTLSKRRVRTAHADSLSRSDTGLSWIGAPILEVHLTTDKPMKRRIRPFLHLLHQPMFDGIVMDVIDTTFEITVVAYLMFPKAPLPKIRFPALDP